MEIKCNNSIYNGLIYIDPLIQSVKDSRPFGINFDPSNNLC